MVHWFNVYYKNIVVYSEPKFYVVKGYRVYLFYSNASRFLAHIWRNKSCNHFAQIVTWELDFNSEKLSEIQKVYHTHVLISNNGVKGKITSNKIAAKLITWQFGIWKVWRLWVLDCWFNLRIVFDDLRMNINSFLNIFVFSLLKYEWRLRLDCGAHEA